MKKIIFVLLAIFFSTSVFSQDDELPSKIDKAFKVKYPKAESVYWYSEENNYKIEFEISPDTYTAIYSENGNWIETSKRISNSEVPAKASTAINKKYPGSEISYAEFVENAKGEKFYRINSYTEEADYIINVTGEGTILNAEKKESPLDDDEG